MTELSIARQRWPSPIDKVLSVNIEYLPTSDIPPYLIAGTLVSIKGNTASDVREAVCDLFNRNKRKLKSLWIKILALCILIIIGLFIAIGDDCDQTLNQPMDCKM